MAAPLVFAAPILPGRQEPWRRLCQELAACIPEGGEQAASAHHVSGVWSWIVRSSYGDLAVIVLELAETSGVVGDQRAASYFQTWLRSRVRELLGVDPGDLRAGAYGELIFQWQQRVATGGNPMSTEQNKALVRRIFEQGMNENNAAVIDDLISPSYVNHDFPTPAPGAAGFKMVVAMFNSAFPDMKVVIEDELAEGDKVVTRGYFTGTHNGNFMGIEPTGRRFKAGYLDIWRIEGGKAVENWVQMDMLGLMQQLGVIPTPGQ